MPKKLISIPKSTFFEEQQWTRQIDEKKELSYHLRLELEAKWGIQIHINVWDEVFRIAWEHGHSMGEHEVRFYADDLMPLVRLLTYSYLLEKENK